MKLRLKSRNMVPHGGTYEINRPDLGMVGQGNTWDMFRNRVADYRRANGIPIGLGFDDELEQHLCARYPAECEGFDATVPKPRSLTLADVMNGTRTMLAFKLAGSPLESREEAERRARICSDCPWNVLYSKPCGGLCQELQTIVKDIVGAQGTPYDINLRTCSLCGCLLQASIWVPLEIQLRSLNDDTRAQFETVPNCWKKPSLLKE